MAARLAGLAAPNTVVMRQVMARRGEGACALERVGLTGAHGRGQDNGGVPRPQSYRWCQCSLPGRTGRSHRVAGAALGAKPRGSWSGGAGHAARAMGKAWPPVGDTGRLRRVHSRENAIWNSYPL
jgi:hypothetical protein